MSNAVIVTPRGQKENFPAEIQQEYEIVELGRSFITDLSAIPAGTQVIPLIPEAHKDALATFKKQVDDCLYALNISLVTNDKLGPMWVHNALTNRNRFNAAQTVHAIMLQNDFDTAYIVGNGPSAGQFAMDFADKPHDGTVFACWHVAHRLQFADYVGHADSRVPGDLTAAPITADPIRTYGVIAPPTTAPAFLQNYKDSPLYAYYGSDSIIDAWFLDRNDKQAMPPINGMVTHMLAMAAIELGYKKIIFVGTELGYLSRAEAERAHPKTQIDVFQTYNGKELFSPINYSVGRHGLEEMAANYPDIKFYGWDDNGMALDGFWYGNDQYRRPAPLKATEATEATEVEEEPLPLCERPIKDLKDKWDWYQAFYELAYGYEWPETENHLAPLIRNPNKQLQIKILELKFKALYPLRETLKESGWVKDSRQTIEACHRDGLDLTLRELFANHAGFMPYGGMRDLWRSVVLNPLIFMQPERPTPDSLHKRWVSETNPEAYMQGEERSGFLELMLQQAGVKEDSRILELGCNVGRNLNHLFTKGYTSLSGVDINHHAIAKMQQVYPEMAAKSDVSVSTIEEFVKGNFNKWDCIFTMAVLEHIHPDSEWVFAELQNMVNPGGCLVIIEDEGTERGRKLDFVFQRDYGPKVMGHGCGWARFEGFGYQSETVVDCGNVPGLGAGYIARVYRRK